MSDRKKVLHPSGWVLINVYNVVSWAVITGAPLVLCHRQSLIILVFIVIYRLSDQFNEPRLSLHALPFSSDSCRSHADRWQLLLSLTRQMGVKLGITANLVSPPVPAGFHWMRSVQNHRRVKGRSWKVVYLVLWTLSFLHAFNYYRQKWQTLFSDCCIK